MKKRIGWLLGIMLLVVLTGCTDSDAGAVNQQAESPRPVPMLLIDTSSQTSSLRFPGRVRSAQRADLAFNVSGQLVELHVEEGKLVKKGQLVARLDDANYRIQMRSALAKYNKAQTDYSRVEKIWQRSQAVAKAEVDRQRTAMDVAHADYALAKKDFDDTRLVAPFSGVVTKRYVENYSNVQDKEPIVSLQDLNELEIVINVPERVVRNTAKHIAGYAIFADQPEQMLPVTLKSFSAESDKQTQSYEVVLTLEPGYELTILPGMSVDIVPRGPLEGLSMSQIKVPLKSIYSNGEHATGVWVVDPDTARVTLREVTLGKVLGADVVVNSGLTGGEKIATAGVSQLREGMLVRPLKDGIAGQ
ncbi:efflux RND transporter periplasmic adaptor subunit [Denitrificimonas sp. JX-1]|uniref:Efflux RND transporter periplasmic adaptor subunit n=1 Tax=Denitrificimonas halotolerans TaxID=3098930 RepID=A0ABU5GU23_9GAMM|nr:efflux RND transporter periplasmic adaptor subunit [Denitrificimonas sp. JX-1]MDY7219133.1 efflux RND transporter periplasmic adaptor subunit [Denitrificimonas sp. JX-1]